MKSKINKADSQCHPHKIHNLPLKPFTAVKVKPKHSVFYLLQCLKYEPGSLTRARVRRIYLLSCQSFSQLLLLYSILFSLSIGFLFIFFSVIPAQKYRSRSLRSHRRLLHGYRFFLHSSSDLHYICSCPHHKPHPVWTQAF